MCRPWVVVCVGACDVWVVMCCVVACDVFVHVDHGL